MAYPSSWLVNYKDGNKVILSEKEYLKYKKERKIEDIGSEEHWFLMEQCIEENPNVEVVNDNYMQQEREDK